MEKILKLNLIFLSTTILAAAKAAANGSKIRNEGMIINTLLQC